MNPSLRLPGIAGTIHPRRRSFTVFAHLLIAILACAMTARVIAASELPDPSKLVTKAELEAIAGKIVAGPQSIDIGGAPACSFTLENKSTVELMVLPDAPARRAFARRKFGGAGVVELPELGKDAFANPSASDDTAKLYVAKNGVLLNVSMPPGKEAVEKLKAIAKKALARL
jgi:hypothetical protein